MSCITLESLSKKSNEILLKMLHTEIYSLLEELFILS